MGGSQDGKVAEQGCLPVRNPLPSWWMAKAAGFMNLMLRGLSTR